MLKPVEKINVWVDAISMHPGTRVELIEVECGQDPECPIPTGSVVSKEDYQRAANRSLPADEVPVRWDQPDFLPEIDCWPADRLRKL